MTKKKLRKNKNKEIYKVKIDLVTFTIVVSLLLIIGFFIGTRYENYNMLKLTENQTSAIISYYPTLTNVSEIIITGEAQEFLNNAWLDSYKNKLEFIYCINASVEGNVWWVYSTDQIYQPILFNQTSNYVEFEQCMTNLNIHSHPNMNPSPSDIDMKSASLNGNATISCVMNYVNAFTCFSANYQEIPVGGELKFIP